MANVTPTRLQQLSSNLIYLERDDKHTQEKPYKLQYDPGDSLPRTNTVNKQHGPISIHDLRSLEKPMSFDKNGFCVVDLATHLEPEDFYDAQKVKNGYYPELQALLLDKFGAARVEILEHLVGQCSLVTI